MAERMTTHPTPPERELVALRIQEWLFREHDLIVSAQDIEQASNTPLSCRITEDSFTRAATVPQGVSADVARMDWLEARGYPGQFYACDDGSPTEKWFDSETIGSDYSPTLRAAIDAAMTPQQGG